MKFVCVECENESKFMATANAQLQVIVDGRGNVVDPRASDQILDNLTQIRPWKCNVCGATDIKDMEGKDDSST